MTEPVYYKLADVQASLSCSRNLILRLERAGMLIIHGANHGRSVTGASYRALARRIAEGEDIWETLRAVERDSESPAPSEPKPMAKARSIKTSAASGGTPRQPETESDLDQFEPLVSKGRGWLKRII